ncbi:kinase-like domain-containing protein [Aspergillus falconensis]
MGARDKRLFTYADFNLDALCRQASTLRQGVPCTCDLDQRPASGSFNWAIFVFFEDGSRWVMRSPHARTFMPMEMGTKLLASEVATLQYLNLHSDIPVPKVYDHSDTFDNEIGIPFILMTEAPGRPLSNFWRPPTSPHMLGAMTWKLSQLRFDKIGSLFQEQGTFHIKECLSRGHVLHERYQLDIPRGPFTSQTDFQESLISAFLEHVEMLELSPHCFVAPVPSQDTYGSHSQYKCAVDLWNDFVTVGCKTDSSNNRLDYIIAGDALRDIVRKLEFPAVNPGSFPLCHADLSVNNIYVDDDYNITCIIDWAFASSVPESVLLAPPGLPQFSDEISPELHTSFIDGFVAAIPRAVDQKNSSRYCENLDRGQLSWRLTRLLNLDSTDDYNLFATVWDSAHGPSEDLQQCFLQQRRSPYFTQLHSKVQQEDQPVSKTKKDEQDYFQNKTLRYTVARKLTFVSEWETQYNTATNTRSIRKGMFVTDSRLWKWILQSMQDWESMS